VSAYRATACCPWCGEPHPLSARMAIVAVCRALARDAVWATCRACAREFYPTDVLRWGQAWGAPGEGVEADTWAQ
jgi:hypothetical protein